MAVPRVLQSAPVKGADADSLARAVRGIAADLDLARQALAAGDPAATGFLQAAGEELYVLEEEIVTQLAELEVAARARRDEHLPTRRLLATLPVPLISTDADGTVLEANAAAAELLAVPVERLTRKPLFAYLAGDSRRIGRGLLATATTRGGTVDGALVLTPRGARPVTCRVTLVPVPVQEAGCPPGEGRVADAVRWVVDVQRTGDEAARASQAALVELCRLGVADADTRSLLRRVTELACEGMAEADAASVVVGDPAEPELVASSSAAAQSGDGVQHLAGSGPVFDAYREGRVAGSRDLLLDPAWPLLARDLASDRPVRSCLALPLLVGEGSAEGVLTLYARAPGRFEPAVTAERAQPYVAAAQALIRDSRLVEELSAVRDQLQTALSTRAVIDQAKGVVMTRRRCSADDAFALLVRMSNTGNRKLHDVAQQIVDEVSPPAR
jgi:PAS domain-containing protein